jgi:hypothetical protein
MLGRNARQDVAPLASGSNLNAQPTADQSLMHQSRADPRVPCYLAPMIM